MEDSFVLTIEHNGKEMNLDTQFMRTGYTHKFKVLVDGLDIFFEPDEEGEYRAILPPDIDEKTARKLDKSLLQNIADTIRQALA